MSDDSEQTCMNCSRPVNLPGGEHYHITKHMNQAPTGDGVNVCSLVCLVQWGTKYATYKTVQAASNVQGLFNRLFKR